MKAGGKVVKPLVGKIYRLNGELALSRSIGDVEFSDSGLIHTPECQEIERTSRDEYLVLCCDGVWDVLSTKQVADLIRKNPTHTPEKMARVIVDTAYRKLSTDNLSCIVIALDKPERESFEEFL